MASLHGAINFIVSAFSNAAIEILAIGIIGTAGYFYRRSIPRYWREVLEKATPPWRRGNGAAGPGYRELREMALKALRTDQSMDGPHYGQFGKSADLADEAKHQTGGEDVAHKPRMYLTSWPSLILHNRRQLKSHVDVAARSVEAMLRSGHIRVAQTSGPIDPTHKSFLISYRHTICAGLMLVLLRGWSPRETNILGEMLDPSARWQNKDGGWAQSDRIYVKSDLWTSAYAARLLHIAVGSPELSPGQIAAAEAALRNTLVFFENEWNRSRWKYGETISEEEILYMLIEMGPALQQYGGKLLSEVIDHIDGWIGLGGGLLNSYVKKCVGVSQLALHTRMSYALYRSGTPLEKWRPVFDRTLQYTEEHANSAEHAFMLDMTYLVSECA